MRSLSKRILLSLFIIVVVASIWGYSVLTDDSAFEENFYQVASAKVTTNIRTVFITDLHLSEFGENNSVLVQRTSELRPDFISIGGDMNMFGEDDYSIVLTLVEQLVGIAPVYYGLGNHEFQAMLQHGSDIYSVLEAAGAVMLHNKFVEKEVRGTKIVVGGLTESEGGVDKYSGDFRERFAANKSFKLLLSHYPCNFFGPLASYDIDLVLSGHTHGGVVIIPFLHHPFTEGRRIQHVNEAGTMHMIVGRGLGISSRVPRFNNRPELVIVDIGPY